MKSTNPADYQNTQRPIAGMPKDFPAGSYIAPHTHRRAQLTWAAEGVMTVTAAEGTWVVPPHRALWIPAGMVHSIRMSSAVAMRALFVEPRLARTVAKTCKVVLMNGLLRELLLEAAHAPIDDDRNGRTRHIEALILDEIRTLDAQPLHLPMPRDKRLRLICDMLLRDPGRHETLEQWADIAGASSRTLARLFAGETGMRFVDWRHQARLAAALVRLAEGARIASVARALGYDSVSAFTVMFRRALGKTPRDYFGPAANN
ncbi:MAG TPA: helix-turn-helix transcriptional regulator [Xanthobacteraceae bacterium]|nr:helix-turn-helix transcriptional regulator [Xanthobacteraceae bacterium]